MTSTHVAQRVQDVAAPILWAMGIDLVEVVCVGQGPRSVVRVFVDKTGGVTVDDCERVHKALSPALDVADPIPHAYTLEVSSPGLDRPLKRRSEYERVIDKLINVKFTRPIDGQWRIVGRVRAVGDGGVELLVTEGKRERTVTLAWDAIALARLEVEF
ncbi:MAG: ribosome maturation factor RimP [Nitrospiraceae bacterium]